MQFDASINLFCLVLLTLELLLQVFFYNSRSTFPLLLLYKVKSTDFIHNGKYFLTIYFITFNFIVLSDLNSKPNNLIEYLSINDFLVNQLDDCSMCINISVIALKISKYSLLGSILINFRPDICSIAFCFFISKSILLLL